MSFEDNPADDRYELDQCIDEIKRLKLQNAELLSACETALPFICKVVERTAFSPFDDCVRARDMLCHVIREAKGSL